MKKIAAILLCLLMLAVSISCSRKIPENLSETETETVEVDNSVLTGKVSLDGDFCEDTTCTADFILVTGYEYDVHYQWYINDTALSGATSKTLQIPVNTAGKSIRVEVFDSFNNKVISESHTIGENDSDIHSFASLLPYAKTFGRCGAIQTGMAFDWSGSGFEMNIDSLGGDFKAYYDGYPSNFVVYIDGTKTSTVSVDNIRGEIVFNVPEGQHNVRLIKDTDIAISEQLSFTIHSIEFQGEVLDRPQDKNLLIEFIGGAVTSGDGVFGSYDSYGWNKNDHSFTNSYAYITATQLDADWSVLSRDKLGISYKVGGYALPEMYKYTNRYRSKETYSFERKADVVVIELGESDNTDNGVKEDAYYSALNTLVSSLRKNNGNEVKIVWLGANADHYASMQKVITNLKDPANVYACLTTYGTGGGNREGSLTGTPNAEEQRAIANDLLNFLKVQCDIYK